MRASDLHRSLPRRAGVSTLEMFAAATVLLAVIGTIVPILARLGRVREVAAEREAAVRELGNIVEIARSEVPRGGGVSRAALEAAGRRIVEERLADRLEAVEFAVRDEAGDAAAAPAPFNSLRPVVLSIRWSAGPGRPQSVELGCWTRASETSAGAAPTAATLPAPETSR